VFGCDPAIISRGDGRSAKSDEFIFLLGTSRCTVSFWGFSNSQHMQQVNMDAIIEQAISSHKNERESIEGVIEENQKK